MNDQRMTSEWLKVMLEEIARKKAEHEQARVEEERRNAAAVESQRCAPVKKNGDAE
jgi:hypothetical protein